MYWTPDLARCRYRTWLQNPPGRTAAQTHHDSIPRLLRRPAHRRGLPATGCSDLANETDERPLARDVRLADHDRIAVDDLRGAEWGLARHRRQCWNGHTERGARGREAALRLMARIADTRMLFPEDLAVTQHNGDRLISSSAGQ